MPFLQHNRTLAFTRRHLLQGIGAATAMSLLPPMGALAQTITDPLAPVALDGSPAQAFASHRARAAGIARSFAMDHSITDMAGKADEDKTFALIAHCQAVRDDPAFATPGQPPSKALLPQVLRRLNKGDGQMGTRRDYDMAVKGLMTLSYRYAVELGDGSQDFILDNLMPDGFSGGHPADIEIYEVTFLNIDIPETENHLLMIESSRYLVNQLRHDRTGSSDFDNRRNGLARWLTHYMQIIAQHDFLEFNARPYQRLALHPMFNLHDFARDLEVKTAARILLDYAMMKYAVSSTRVRRVTPFRRLQHRINHQANLRNYLFSDQGDQVAGMFAAVAGMVDPHFAPAPFPVSLRDTGLIAGLSDYRPPPGPYIVALDPATPKAYHIFSHGQRPQLRGSSDLAEGGTEIYYRSPSFVMAAGGSFLNSGYGRDEFDIGVEAWEQTSRAQATTLIPARADVLFHDLIRFEPYPDPRVDPYADDPKDPDTLHSKAVNLSVARGFMAGGNLRPAGKKTVLENTSGDGPSLALHDNTLFIGFKGAGNNNLNVARVQTTRLLGIDGVEGLDWKTTLADSSPTTPALASHEGRLFIAWTGEGDGNLNLAFSEDHGVAFVGKTTFGDTSERGPTLASYKGRLYIAWTGTDDHLNVARVAFFANTNGGFGIDSLESKVVLNDISENAPALAAHAGKLYLSWTGTGDGNLNLLVSDDGHNFTSKITLTDISSHGPSLASHGHQLYLGWKGTGDGQLNVAPVTLIANTAGAFGIEGIGPKVVLGERSDEAPALGSVDGMLCLGWTGLGEEFLNLRVSVDGAFSPPSRWTFIDKTDLGFWLAIYRAPVEHPDQLIEPLDDLGFLYAVEAADMTAQGIDFTAFSRRTFTQNTHLPDRLAYGGNYRFFAPDGRTFSVWLEMTGPKDTPHVQEIGREIVSFGALPLVSGEFMNAPGGHDGLIELRHPNCGAPVVLDFRNADRPIRTEQRTACPKPWVDRVLALFSVARALHDQGRSAVAHATLLEGLALHAELLAEDAAVMGPLLAGGTISALAAIGIDYSVPESDLRDWLGNPTFTPYPALAQALLSLGRQFPAPVFVDVIVWKYEHAPGATSPRHVKDVRLSALRAAVLAAWNERYGRHENSFDVISSPL